MKHRAGTMVALTVLWTGMGLLVSCQVSPAGQSTRLSAPAPQSQAVVSRPAARDIIRQIDDPHTGDRWLLMRDPAHPGGPGRLIRVAGALGEYLSAPKAAALRPSVPEHPAQPVIRSGDRLVVEESTPKVEARYEAVALGRASAGSPLRVRLVLGGKVVQVVALGPGRAAFAPAMEVLR